MSPPQRARLATLSSYSLLFLAFYLILTRNLTIAVELASADQLYFEEIYQGLFLSHVSIHNFSFMAAPDFLHLLVYFACRALMPMQAAFVSATLLSILLFYLLFLRITRFITQDPNILHLYRAVILLGITLLALSYFWVMGSFDAALFYADHFLNIGVMSLLSLWLVLIILFNCVRPLVWLILLFSCVFSTSLSDPTYLTCFSGPVLFALTLLFLRRKMLPFPARIYPVFMIITVASVMGFWALKHLALIHIHIDYSYIVFYSGAQLRITLRQMLQGMSLFMLNNALLFFLWLYSLYFLLRNTANLPLHFIKTFILAGVGCGIIAMLFFDPDIAPGVQIMHLNNLLFRHMAPFIYLPIFVTLPLVMANIRSLRLKGMLARYALILVLCCQILILLLVKPLVSLPYLFDPPTQHWPWLMCVDQTKAKYQLQAGIANYWTARPISLLSHLPVVPVTAHLAPYYWLANKQDLTQQNFDFAVVSADPLPWELPANTVIQKYGLPVETVLCPGIPVLTSRLTVLIYARDQKTF